MNIYTYICGTRLPWTRSRHVAVTCDFPEKIDSKHYSYGSSQVKLFIIKIPDYSPHRGYDFEIGNLSDFYIQICPMAPICPAVIIEIQLFLC